MAHDQPGNCHLPGLADTVGPVRSLILDGRIPPGIHVVDIGSPGEVEPFATRLKADQEYRRLSRILERQHQFFPTGHRGGSVQPQAGKALVQSCAD